MEDRAGIHCLILKATFTCVHSPLCRDSHMTFPICKKGYNMLSSTCPGRRTYRCSWTLRMTITHLMHLRYPWNVQVEIIGIWIHRSGTVSLRVDCIRIIWRRLLKFRFLGPALRESTLVGLELSYGIWTLNLCRDHNLTNSSLELQKFSRIGMVLVASGGREVTIRKNLQKRVE